MEASDFYILKQDGKRKWLNDEGKKLVVQVIDVVAGQRNVAKMIGCADNTISRLRQDGRCAHKIWEGFFEAAKKLVA